MANVDRLATQCGSPPSRLIFAESIYGLAQRIHAPSLQRMLADLLSISGAHFFNFHNYGYETHNWPKL